MTLLETLRKRWRIATALFALTLIATVFAFVEFPWTYSASANMLIVPSKSQANQYGGNPYLAFNYPLNETANVLTYQAQGAQVVAELAAAGDTSSYTVVNAPGASAPVLLVTVTGSNANTVERTLTAVTQKIIGLLAAGQPGVSPANQITIENITFSTSPSKLSGKKARPLIVVLGVGILLTFAIPSILDAAATRGRRRAVQGTETGTKDAVARQPHHYARPHADASQYRNSSRL